MTIDYHLNEAILQEHSDSFERIIHGARTLSPEEFSERYKGLAADLEMTRLELLAYIREYRLRQA